MSAALLLVLAFGLQEPAANTKVYTDNAVGLTFTYPAAWTLTKGRRETRIQMKLDGQSAGALLEFHVVGFRGETSVWEDTQRQINEQLGHTVVRQWQEEILGVPFLFTKVQLKPDADGSKTLLTGLMYAALDKKLLFRLTAPNAAFEQAEFEWRKVLESLRTLDGTIPKPEDPNRPESDPKNPASTGANPVKPPPFAVLGPKAKAEIVKGEVRVPAEAGGKSWLLCAPKGWTLERREDGGFTATAEGLGVAAEIKVHSTLDSETPARALASASATSLKAFERVAKREESLPKPNLAGASLAWVWRQGTAPEGPLTVCEAVGSSNDAYWFLRWRVSGEPTADQRRLLFELMKGMSVEPSP